MHCLLLRKPFLQEKYFDLLRSAHFPVSYTVLSNGANVTEILKDLPLNHGNSKREGG